MHLNWDKPGYLPTAVSVISNTLALCDKLPLQDMHKYLLHSQTCHFQSGSNGWWACKDTRALPIPVGQISPSLHLMLKASLSSTGWPVLLTLTACSITLFLLSLPSCFATGAFRSHLLESTSPTDSPPSLDHPSKGQHLLAQNGNSHLK